jgi:serine protease Do
MARTSRTASKVAWIVAWLVVGYLVALVASAHAGEVPPAGAQELQQVFERVAPSVVAIRAQGRDAMSGSQTRIIERGSGVLISEGGRVLTAAYVVHGMEEITVEFSGGVKVSARVVASEPAAADLALLQLERVPLGSTVSPMADSDWVRIGDTVLVVGAPYRLPHSLSVGTIRARWAPNTAYRTMPLAEFFQADATIDAGNSGGPMFNLRGEVIGIVSHNISTGDRSDQQGFVVTSNTGRQLLLDSRSAETSVAKGSCSGPRSQSC